MRADANTRDRVSAALAELREAARRDLGTAWEQRLRAAVQEEADRILRARIAELRARLEEAVQFDVGWRLAAEIDAAAPALREKERRFLNEHWNRSVRRLLQYESEAAWASALVDAAGPFGSDVAIFFVRGGRLEGDGISVSLSDAPAFRSAVESRDTMVAMATPGEVSSEIAGRSGPSRTSRCFMFPVVADGRVPAVLYAAGEQPDVQALEALAAIAGAAIAARARPVEPALGIASAPPAPERSAESLRAEQFARVEVARMLLERNGAVHEGRSRRDLYGALKKEIDAAREVYARTFALPDDYLHLELVRTLAEGDLEAMGGGYPGPLNRAV